MELVEILYKEKESCNNEMMTYGTLAFRVLPVSLGIFAGLLLLTKNSVNDKVLIILPYLLIFFISILSVFTLLTYAADLARRSYERAINELIGGVVLFKNSSILNELWNHDAKTGYSKPALINLFITYGIVLLVYIGVAYLATEKITQPWQVAIYSFSIVSLPLILLMSFASIASRFKKRALDNELHLMKTVLDFKKSNS